MSRYYTGRNLLRLMAILMLVACVHQSIATGSIAGYTLTGNAAELQDNDKLSQAMDAFGAARYADAIRIGRDLIENSSDPDVLDEAKQYVILSTRFESGYDAAMQEIANLNASTALSDVVDLIKSQQTSYNEGVAEQAKIITENPGTKAARNAELEICRFKDVNSTRQEAISAYEQLCAKYKGQLVARNATFALARICSLSGDFEKAKQVLVQFAVSNSRNPQSERAINKLGEILIQNKRYDEGVAYFRSLQQAHKDDLNTPMGAAIARNIGVLLEFQGSHSDALSACTESIKRAGNCISAGEAVKLTKKIYMALKQPTEAMDRMSAIQSAYPGTESAACAECCVAEVYLAQGRMDLAAKAFNPDSHKTVAGLHLKFGIEAALGQLDAAVATAEQLEREYPKTYALSDQDLHKLGTACIHKGEYDLSIRLYGVMKRTIPNLAAFADNFIGYTLSRKGDYEKSNAQFAQIINQYQGQAEWGAAAQFKIGYNYLLQKNYEEAVKAFQKVLDYYPNSTWAPGAAENVTGIQLHKNEFDK